MTATAFKANYGPKNDSEFRMMISMLPDEALAQLKAEKSPGDDWEVLGETCLKQLEIPDITDQRRTLLIGLFTIAKMHYRTRSDKNVEYAGRQNSGPQWVRTNNIIGKKVGIAPRTVDSAVAFVKGISAIKEIFPELANEILAGRAKGITKMAVKRVGIAQKSERPELIAALANGTPMPPAAHKRPASRSNARRELMNRIRADVEATTSTEKTELTIEDLSEMLRCDVRDMVSRLNEVLSNNGHIITKEIKNRVTASIKQLKTLQEVL